MIFGDIFITFNTKLSNFRGHYVPLESKFRGHLKQKRAKSPFFEGQGKPCLCNDYNSNTYMMGDIMVCFYPLGTCIFSLLIGMDTGTWRQTATMSWPL